MRIDAAQGDDPASMDPSAPYGWAAAPSADKTPHEPSVVLHRPLPPYAHRRHLRSGGASDEVFTDATALSAAASGDDSVPPSRAGDIPDFVAPWLDPHSDNGARSRRRRRWASAVLPLLTIAGAGCIVGGSLVVRRGTPSITTAADNGGTDAKAVATTSTVPAVSALGSVPATVRFLAGGPDELGNGGTADRALLRRPTSVVRTAAGLIVSDAGILRRIRPDGGIEGVVIDGLPPGFRLDELAGLPDGGVLAADTVTARFVVVTGIGTDAVKATPVASTGIVAPVALAADSKGRVLVADPGSGSVWRWEPGRTPALVTSALLAPVSVAPLPDDAMVVTDRRTGLVVTVDQAGVVTPIAADTRVAPLVRRAASALRATPIGAQPAGPDAVNVLLVDGSITRVALVPRGGRGLLVTEFLSGATALASDGDAMLVVESGERRILRVSTDSAGRGSLATVIGGAAWPQINPDVLLARDVVLIDPTGVAVSSDGSVIVADRGANVVWRLAADGSALRIAGDRAWGNSVDNADAAASGIASPTDVAVTADGTVLFTEPGLARVRAIGPNGSLKTVLRAAIGQPGQALLSPGPLAVSPSGSVVVGDRFIGGLWLVRSGPVTPISGVNPGTRFVAVTASSTSVVGIDANGLAVSVDGAAVLATATNVVSSDAVVRAAAATPGEVAIAVGAGSVNVGDALGALRVLGWSGAVAGRDDVVAMTSQNGSLVVATSGRRASVARVTGAETDVLTSTAIGSDEGRANETAVFDPVSLDITRNGSVLITDRGGARVRSLRGGVITTLAGNGRNDTRRNPTANAASRSLGALRDAVENDDGSLSVVDGGRILIVDGSGLVTERTVRDPDGNTISVRSISDRVDGVMYAVGDNGMLVRLDASKVTVVTTSPSLARIRRTADGTLIGVTNGGGLVELRGTKLVAVASPRDLPVVSVDALDGRLVALGRDGSVVERDKGQWRRLELPVALVPDRRTNHAAPKVPTDIAISDDGAILVADAGLDAVLVYRVNAAIST